MTKTETRSQFRATCPICFKEHAVRDTDGDPVMVTHGYTRPQGWHQNVNECSGTTRPHFGTKAGRVVAAGNAEFIRRWAQGQRDSAATLRSTPPATVTVNGKYDHAAHKYEQISVDSSDRRYADRLASMISHCEGQAKMADQSAREIEKLVAEWKPIAPREVEVETGPTIHAVNAYWKSKGRTVALCSSSSFRGSYKQTSPDRANVNCKACLKSLAATDADAVVTQKADALIAEMVAKYGESAKVQFSDASEKAIKEIRYNRKEIDKDVRKRATDRLERGVK